MNGSRRFDFRPRMLLTLACAGLTLAAFPARADDLKDGKQALQ